MSNPRQHVVDAERARAAKYLRAPQITGASSVELAIAFYIEASELLAEEGIHMTRGPDEKTVFS